MTPTQTELLRRSLRGMVLFTLASALLLFLPAWTLDYWQAWLFLGLFAVLCAGGTLYFIKTDPALVERRLSAGPTAETEPTQKRIMTAASAVVILLYVLPGLDRHFRWSEVSAPVVLLADLVYVLAFFGIYRVFRENTFAASTIGTAADQRVIATGPYAVVRHPMYSAALVMFAAMPLALGSWWTLPLIVPLAGILAWRLLDEERYLRAHLSGYEEYCRRTPYRLAPGLW
jgi:protein-S-isoprenylcysteine O-methyltransferase Ste14